MTHLEPNKASVFSEPRGNAPSGDFGTCAPSDLQIHVIHVFVSRAQPVCHCRSNNSICFTLHTLTYRTTTMANPGYWAQPQQAYGQVSPPPGPISPGQIYPSQFQTPFMGHAKAPPPPPQLPQNSQWTGHAGHGGQGQYQQGFGQQPLAHQQQVGQYPGPYPPTGHYPGPQRVSPMPSPPLIAPAPSPPNMYRPPAQAQTHQAQAQTDPRLWDAGRARHETRYQSSQMFESYVREVSLQGVLANCSETCTHSTIIKVSRMRRRAYPLQTRYRPWRERGASHSNLPLISQSSRCTMWRSS